MMQKVYTCNLCHEKDQPDKMVGLRFSNMRDFKIDDARSTDGTHICTWCLDQLTKQLRAPVTEPEGL